MEVVGVELSQSHLDTLLGSANSPGHGIICIKCTKYRRLKREILALEENTTNAVSGIIKSTFETVAVTPERAGQKRTCMQDSHIQDHSPAKKLHLSFPSRAPSMAYVTDCLPAIVLSSKLLEAHWRRSLQVDFSTSSNFLALEKHRYHIHSHRRLYSLTNQASAM